MQNMCFFAPALPLEDVFDPTGAGGTLLPVALLVLLPVPKMFHSKI